MARDRDLHKLTQGAGPPRLFPRPELMRLGVFFCLAVVVTLLLLWQFGSEPRRQTPLERPPEPTTPKIDPSIEVDPWNPPKRRLNLIIKRETRGERYRSYPEAANLLATLVLDRPHVYFLHDEKYKDVGHYELTSVKKLLDTNLSLELRAQPVEVQGIARKSTDVDPFEEFGLAKERFPEPLRLVTFETDDGPFQAVYLDRDRRKMPSVAPGQRYKARGVFYRLRDLRREFERDGQTVVEYSTVPMIFAKSIVPMIPLELLDELPLGFANQIKHTRDQSYIPPPPQQDPNFYILVGYVLKHWGKLPGPEDEVEFVKGHGVVETPEDYCLRFVETRGEIVYLNWESFEYEDVREGDALTRGYWHCVISHLRPSVNTPISLLIPHEKLPEGFVKNAVVRARGIYFRTHAYKQERREALRTKSVWVRTPLVVATGFPVPDPIEYRRDSEPFLLWMIGLGLVFTAGLLIMLRRDRSRARVLEGRLRTQRTERRRTRGMDLNRVAEEVRKERRGQ